MEFKDRCSLFKGDCLEVMDKLIEDGIKVDLILCDPPYGTTNCKWDSVIPIEDMWARLKLLRKDKNTPTLLFNTEPFGSILRVSNIKEYIKLSTKDNNNYNIKVSDLILNSNNTNTITISIDELNNTITLDYTELFKIDNNNLNKEIVTIKYTNINKINSLEE